MSIQAQVNELDGVQTELKTLNIRAKKLRIRKKQLEEQIATYISAMDLPGVKHNGKEIVLEKKTGRTKKTNKQRDESAEEVLKRYGIKNSNLVLQEVLEARKGELVEIEKLKTKKPKKQNVNKRI